MDQGSSSLCVPKALCFKAQQIVCLFLDLCVSYPKCAAFSVEAEQFLLVLEWNATSKTFQEKLFVLYILKKKKKSNNVKKPHNFSIDQKRRCPHLGKPR